MILGLREAFEEHVVPLGVLAIATLLAGRSFVGATSMGMSTQGADDFALWWCWLTSGLVALWLGSRCLADPLTTGSARLFLVGPLPRHRWTLTRLLSHALVAGLFFLALGAVLLTNTALPLGPWMVLTLAELGVVFSLTALLGSMLPPLPTLVCGFLCWWIGHLAGPWSDVMVSQGQGGLASGVLAVLPDFDRLDAHAGTLAGRAPGNQAVALGLLWASAWIVGCSAATVAVVERKDL